MAYRMASPKRASGNHGLFDKSASKGVVPALSRKTKAKFEDVGGNGDCGYRAIAAALIDHSYDNALSEALLTNLLDYFFSIAEFNKKYRHYAWGNTAQERMKHLTELDARVLVPDLAFALRQMAVDEICRDPATYRGAFVEQNEETSPAHMRKPTTYIDESAIAALADRLHLPITVQYVEPGRDIYKSFSYNEAAKTENPRVEIKLKAKHYLPKLVHSERFSAVRSQAIDTKKLPSPSDNDRPMQEILEIIATEDKRIEALFKDTKKRLQSHVDDGSINKDFLINLYIQNMSFNGDDYLSGRIAHICNDYNNQDFRDAIHLAQKGQSAVSFGAQRDKPIVKELIHAIARAITIGQINGEDAFEQIEQRSSSLRLSM